jgi:hypothetical protein
MRSESLDLELIRDSEIVTAVCAEIISIGRILICEGCGDVDALIIAFLVFSRAEEAWPLCGTCLRKLPLEATMA